MGKLWHGGLGFPEQWTATGGREREQNAQLDDRSIGGIKFGILDGGDEAVSDTSRRNKFRRRAPSDASD